MSTRKTAALMAAAVLLSAGSMVNGYADYIVNGNETWNAGDKRATQEERVVLTGMTADWLPIRPLI